MALHYLGFVFISNFKVDPDKFIRENLCNLDVITQQRYLIQVKLKESYAYKNLI